MRMFQGCGSFTSRIQVYRVRGRGIITCMQPRLVGGVWGLGGGLEVVCHKKSSVLSKPTFAPPPQ